MKRFKKIYIEITNFCNLSCQFCANSGREKIYMNLHNFEHILKEIKPFTDYIYLHILGEPLIHPDIEGILKLAKEYGFYVNLTTNGTLLADNIEALIKYPVRQINISLHSFEHFTDKDFEYYLTYAIKSAKEIIKKTSAVVSFRLWNITKKISPRQIEIINKLKASFDGFEEDFNKNRIAIQKNVYLSFEKPFEWPDVKRETVICHGTCKGLKSMCGILSDGTVTACCLDYDGHINLGNIFKESFNKILDNKKTTAIIEGFNKNNLVEPICQKCAFRQRFN